MKCIRIVIVVHLAMCFLLGSQVTLSASQLYLPQTHWVFDKVLVPVGPSFAFDDLSNSLHVGVDGSGNIVARAGSQMRVFDPEGNQLASWSCAATNPYDNFGVNANGKIVAWCGTSLLIFDEQGSQQQNVVLPASVISQNTKQVVVKDDGSFTALATPPPGAGQQLWQYNADNSLAATNSAFGPGGVPLSEQPSIVSAGTNQFLVGGIYLINADGTYSRTLVAPQALGSSPAVSASNGLIFRSRSAPCSGAQTGGHVKIYDLDLREVGCIDQAFGGGPILGTNGASSRFVQNAAMGRNGDLILGIDAIGLVRFRQAGRSFPSSIMPRRPNPEVLGVSSRSAGGHAIVDVDYVVHDADSALLQVAALAFSADDTSLSSAIRLSTLIEGTTANVGAAVPSESSKRISWDVTQDLGASGFVSLAVEVLANDGRALIDVPFVEVPANVPNPGDVALTISTWPIDQSAMLSAWYWLIATADPNIVFLNGEVRGSALSGPFSNQLLASGLNTTIQGEDFLCSQLGVRRATQNEIDRARAGTTPGIQGYTPLARVGGSPVAVNEVGVDVSSSGLWVARLP